MIGPSFSGEEGCGRHRQWYFTRAERVISQFCAERNKNILVHWVVELGNNKTHRTFGWIMVARLRSVMAHILLDLPRIAVLRWNEITNIAYFETCDREHICCQTCVLAKVSVVEPALCACGTSHQRLGYHRDLTNLYRRNCGDPLFGQDLLFFSELKGISARS